MVFVFQVGERCAVGWGAHGSLLSGLCHSLWLPLWVPEQTPAGALPAGHWQRLALHVWEVLSPRLGLSVPAQPPANELCGSSNRQPRPHDPGWVSRKLTHSPVLRTSTHWPWALLWQSNSVPPYLHISTAERLISFCILVQTHTQHTEIHVSSNQVLCFVWILQEMLKKCLREKRRLVHSKHSPLCSTSTWMKTRGPPASAHAFSQMS